MLRFLRKYNKIILAVFGSVLMVVFLVPQAVQQFGGAGGNRAVARLAGETISAQEMTAVQLDLQVLQEIDRNLLGILGLQQPIGEHWLMLIEMAERGGFVGGPQDGRNFLRTAAQTFVDLQRQQIAAQYGPDIVDQLFPADQVEQQVRELVNRMDQNRAAAAVRVGGDERRVDMTLARANGIIRMYEAYLSSAQLSRMESISLARRFYDTAIVDFTVVPADEAMSEVEDPTEQEIQEHFETYRSVAPGEGEYGIGYLREPAVRLEWLMISPGAFEENIEIDRIEAFKRFKRNEDTSYQGRTFDDVRGQIERGLRQERVREIMELAMRTAQAEILKATQTLESDGRFKALPPDWAERRADYGAVANEVNAAVRDQFDLGANIASARPPGPFMTENAVSQLAEISSAQLQSGTRSIPFIDLAFSVRELNEEAPYGLQAGLTGPPVRDDSGNVFFFRVLEARPESPPPSVAVIRGDIIENIRRIKAFEILDAQAPSFRERAASSLESLASQIDSDIQRNVTVGVTGMQDEDGRPVSALFNTEENRRAIMARVNALDPREGRFQQIDPLDLTIVLPLKRTQSLAVVKIRSIEPISIENYRALEPRVRVDFREIGEPYSGDSPFGFDELARRLDFERIERDSDEEIGGDRGRPATPTPLISG